MKKLKGKNIAVYFGTFAPLHTGHMSNVTNAIEKYNHDGVVVIVSGKHGDRADEVELSLDKRFEYLSNYYKDNDLVIVRKLDENNMPTYPNGWDVWTKELIRLAKDSIDSNSNLTFYVGEKIYVDNLEPRISSLDSVILVDRTTIDISGTAIRNNPIKYWDYICPTYQPHFKKLIDKRKKIS